MNGSFVGLHWALYIYIWWISSSTKPAIQHCCFCIVSICSTHLRREGWQCFQYVDEILHTGSFNLRDVFILNVLPQHGVININLLNIQNLWSLCILDSAIAGSKPGWKRRRVGHGVATTSRVMGSSNMHFGPILMQFRDFNQLKNANFSSHLDIHACGCFEALF